MHQRDVSSSSHTRRVAVPPASRPSTGATGGRSAMSQTLTRTKTTRTTGTTGRFYDITHADGTTARYPSVTTILSAIAKPALVGWAAKEERLAVTEAAADLYADTASLHTPLARASYL